MKKLSSEKIKRARMLVAKLGKKSLHQKFTEAGIEVVQDYAYIPQEMSEMIQDRMDAINFMLPKILRKLEKSDLKVIRYKESEDGIDAYVELEKGYILQVDLNGNFIFHSLEGNNLQEIYRAKDIDKLLEKINSNRN